MVSFSVRRAGIISFAVGMIMFIASQYASFPLNFLAQLIVPQSLASAVYFALPAGGIVLIFAGAIMFAVGRGDEKRVATPSP